MLGSSRVYCIHGRGVAAIAFIAAAIALASTASAQDRQFKQTHGRGQYVHWIELYDVDGRKIDPAAEAARPYSPAQTCAKCHDVAAIGHGFHFNAAQPNPAHTDRPAEPWIWVDRRTGTQIPLSHRPREGLFTPADLAVGPWDFTLKFGRHLPGGGISEGPSAGHAETNEAARWSLSGPLEIDCMVCHSADRSYKAEARSEQIASLNFAYAPTAAAEIGHVEGEVSRLPRDFDPAAASAAEGSPRLPTVKYRPDRFDATGKAFFDVTLTPTADSCYFCHSTRPVGVEAAPKWTHDGDVHLSAGLSCSDCHRNALDHHTVRGFEGERLPGGEKIETLSCRGCHYGSESSTGSTTVASLDNRMTDLGGRFGSPHPRHEGIPPLHFEELSCTACHSGPIPAALSSGVQTSMAHALGIASQAWSDDMPPAIAEPVWLEGHDGKLAPHRMVWPAYWGYLEAAGDRAIPLPPEPLAAKLRRVLRVRQDFQEELGAARLTKPERETAITADRAALPDDQLTAEESATLTRAERSKATTEFRAKLVEALKAITEDVPQGATPVYLSAGKLYRLNAAGDGLDIAADHPAAKPYAWPIAHDVRPARQSLGAAGCTDCHSAGSPVQYGTIRALGPAPDDAPLESIMHSHMNLDPTLLAAWDNSFEGRSAFKTVGLVGLGLLALIAVAWLLRGIGAITASLNRLIGGPGE